ncbi:DUF4288 domain-containing protein [Allofranklinella schreckenbergeri]|uniref:DUF4288 domain-containing protein n=1 Tax=Allofranklinella schreckenbergeri TaxID=1076744 RepID=A0A3M6Q3V4_9BURK|nr:DUF4288 domain-containing protein [Allofranklinella schreckenbergeri]RMW97815.1 DUF4288 domain-containing protein [Allofranklinella schreckenbergeri]
MKSKNIEQSSIKPDQNYYSASIFFRSSINGDSDNSNIWEEQIVLLQAASEEQALKLAERYAVEQESSYKNVEGHTVAWAFFTIERLIRIDDFNFSGVTEVFSRFLKYGEVQSLLQPFDD